MNFKNLVRTVALAGALLMVATALADIRFVETGPIQVTPGGTVTLHVMTTSAISNTSVIGVFVSRTAGLSFNSVTVNQAIGAYIPAQGLDSVFENTTCVDGNSQGDRVTLGKTGTGGFDIEAGTTLFSITYNVAGNFTTGQVCFCQVVNGALTYNTDMVDTSGAATYPAVGACVTLTAQAPQRQVTVTLPDYAASDPCVGPVHVEYTICAGSTTRLTGSFDIPARATSGSFTYAPDPGDTTICIKASHWTSKKSSIPAGTGPYTVSAGANGDINGDDFVDPNDFVLYQAAEFSFCGDPNYDPLADLNGDGFVDPLDFDIYVANEFAFGDVCGCP